MPSKSKPTRAVVPRPSVEAPTGSALAKIPPEKIQPNPLNPRMFFRDSTIEQLAESIGQIGVLVPITVYPDTGPAGTTHVLLDGERRLRAAKLINHPEMPAWVIPKPDGVENMLRMFNIHMLREEWDEIATAWALEKLMQALGTDDVTVLSERTGLTPDRIRSMKTVLAQPKEYQQMVADGEITFSFLVELDRHVLSKKRKSPEVLADFTVDALRDVFVQKHERGVAADPIDFRKVGQLMNTARQEGDVADRANGALQQLVQEPAMTIEEAYELGAAASVELRRVLRDVRDLPRRLKHVAGSELEPDERKEFRRELMTLRKEVQEIIASLRGK